MNLLLFDIDGTLLDTGGAGLRALRSAWIEEFALHHRAGDFPRLELAGSTDSGIVRHLLDHFGMPRDESLVARFYHRYGRHLEAELSANRGPREGRVLPGVPALLSRLQAGSGHALGLLTGNIAAGARVKVERFGLGGIFAFGAFGDDHHDRDRLGPVALDRARLHTGREFPPRRVFIIGDTPKDIRCARACGAWAIAVATGAYSRDALAEHAPDRVFDDFTDAGAFLEAIESLAER